jgi:hypothetical protein
MVTHMTTVASLSKDGTHIVAQIVGEHTLETARQGFAAVAALMTTTGITKILVDARQIVVPFDTMDAYETANIAAAPMFRRATFAVVVSPSTATGPPFIETVAVNRGVNIRYFDDYDQALAWLGVKSDGQ